MTPRYRDQTLFARIAGLAGVNAIPYTYVTGFRAACLEKYEESLARQNENAEILPVTKPDDRWFTHRFLRYCATWDYTVNDDLKTLRGVYRGDYELESNRPRLDYIPVVATPLSGLNDPSDYRPRLIDFTYPNGQVTLSDPSPGDNLSFHIIFNPPLRMRSRVAVRFEYVVPRHKCATLDYMRERLLELDSYDLRDYERNVFRVDCPTSELTYELRFADSTCILPRAAEATWQGMSNQQETEILGDGESYTTIQDNGWVMRLHRIDPLPQMVDQLAWRLPRLAELERKVPEVF